MALSFDTSGQLTAPFGSKQDQDGRIIIFARAHTTLTAGTPYRVKYDEYGPFTAAIADDADSYRVGVAKLATVTGGIAELVHGGPYSGMVTPSLSCTVGHGLGIRGGAITDEGADFDDLHDAVFALVYTASTTSTTQDVIMIPEVITAST